MREIKKNRKLLRFRGGDEYREEYPRHSSMNPIANKTRIAEDTSHRLGELTKSLKGWNLIAGLYEDTRSSHDDLIHAYANEARELVLLSLRLTFELGAAGMKENKSRFEHLLKRLNELDEREKKLASFCREVMRRKENAQ